MAANAWACRSRLELKRAVTLQRVTTIAVWLSSGMLFWTYHWAKIRSMELVSQTAPEAAGQTLITVVEKSDAYRCA